MQRFITFLGWTIAVACAISAAAFFVSLFVIACRLVPSGHEGDLGTWAGAVFAGLAFAGTIWISTATERRRREELRVRGAIVLPSLVGYASEIRIRCGTIANCGAHWLATDQQERNKDLWDALINCALSESELFPTIPDSVLVDVAALSFAIAGELHTTQAVIRMGKGFIKSIKGVNQIPGDNEAGWIEEHFRACSDNLEIAISEIQKLKRLHGWPND